MGNSNQPKQEHWHHAEYKLKELAQLYPNIDPNVRIELLKDCLVNIGKNVKPPKEYVWDPNIVYNYETRDDPNVQLVALNCDIWKLRTRMYDPSKP